jgi:hypothetical protein
MTNAYSQTFAFDEAPGFVKRDVAQVAVTATGFIGTQLDQGAAVFTDMVLVLNVEAVDVSSVNEVYTFRVVCSNLANRSDGEVVAMATLGHAATITIETRNTAAGDRIVVPFRTEKNRTAFRYVDLHLTAAGTTPSITFSAYLADRAA